MKKIKNILIITGIIILLLLLLGWGYILLFGTPINNDGGIFANLPNQSTEREIDTTTTEQTVATTNQLQPLTTDPVAGFIVQEEETGTTTEKASSSTREVLRYIERGTGHIYEIELDSGKKERISSNTFGKTVRAVFSPDGSKAVIQTESGDSLSNTLINIGSEETESLPQNIDNLFISNDSIFYTETTEKGSTAYQLNFGGAANPIWQIPFTDIRVFWEEGKDIVVNRPSPNFKSSAYLVDENGWNILIEPQYQLNLATDTSGENILYSYFDTKKGMVTLSLPSSRPEGLLAIPEKCIYMTTKESFWCAMSPLLGGQEGITDWYSGAISTNDTIWSNWKEPGSTQSIARLDVMSGFNIDVTNLTANKSETKLFFINKIDGSLWMYSIPE